MPGPELPGGWRAEAPLASRPDRIVLRARRDGGGPVVLKATPPGARWAARAALRREGCLLALVRGAGVADLLDVVDGRGLTLLVLRFLPAGPLTGRDAPDPERVGRLLVETVDRLHRLGVVHGALRPEHVALTAEGTPVLVGFGAAHRGGDPRPDTVALADLLRSLRPGRIPGRHGRPDRGPRGY